MEYLTPALRCGVLGTGHIDLECTTPAIYVWSVKCIVYDDDFLRFQPDLFYFRCFRIYGLKLNFEDEIQFKGGRM